MAYHWLLAERRGRLNCRDCALWDLCPVARVHLEQPRGWSRGGMLWLQATLRELAVFSFLLNVVSHHVRSFFFGG